MSSAIAARTALTVSPSTRGWWLMTRETVELETPARFATSAIDIRCVSLIRPLKLSKSVKIANRSWQGKGLPK